MIHIAHVLIFLLVVCLAFAMASCAFDALANYENAQTDQVEIREYERTNRALIHQAGVNAGVDRLLPLPTLAAPGAIPTVVLP